MEIWFKISFLKNERNISLCTNIIIISFTCRSVEHISKFVKYKEITLMRNVLLSKIIILIIVLQYCIFNVSLLYQLFLLLNKIFFKCIPFWNITNIQGGQNVGTLDWNINTRTHFLEKRQQCQHFQLVRLTFLIFKCKD